MNNSIVHGGAERLKVNCFELQQQQYGYVGELTFWRRNVLFQILAHSVYKM